MSPAQRGIAREEDEPGAVLALGRQLEPEPRGLAAEEPIGHLDQDARAVARVRLAAARAAVQQVDEHLQRLLDDRVRPLAFDVDDEPHPARVMLERGIVQTLSWRQSFLWHTGVIGYDAAIAKRNLQMPSMHSGSGRVMRGAHATHAYRSASQGRSTATPAGCAGNHGGTETRRNGEIR